MPYRLRKVPKKDLYWVVGEDGQHHSKEGLPKKKAEAQMKALYIAMKKKGELSGKGTPQYYRNIENVDVVSANELDGTAKYFVIVQFKKELTWFVVDRGFKSADDANELADEIEDEAKRLEDAYGGLPHLEVAKTPFRYHLKLFGPMTAAIVEESDEDNWEGEGKKKIGGSMAEDVAREAGPDIPAEAMKPKGKNMTMVGGVPLYCYWEICKQTYKLNKGQRPLNNIDNPVTGGAFNLKGWTNSLLYYSNGEVCIIGVRGSATKEDWTDANRRIPFNKLIESNRAKEDLKAVREFEAGLRKSQPQLKFYATGHSLGGAMCDLLLASGLAKLAVTYNPAIEPQYKHYSHNHRIYNEWDPLYLVMGQFATTYQVRRGDKKPKDWAGWILDKAAAWDPSWMTRTLEKLYNFGGEKLYAHDLDRFIGGKSTGKSWGPDIWQELHTFAKEEKKEEFKQYLDSLTKTLPCPNCRKNLATYLKLHPVVGSTERYAWKLHNAVNKDLGKPILSFKEAQKHTKNALYGGIQCRTFTEAECIDKNGIFDPSTSNCFVNGEDLGSKDCDGPPPAPFKPVPYVPGKPDQPPAPEPEPFKPVPYVPGKPDQPPAPAPVNPPSGFNPCLATPEQCGIDARSRLEPGGEWDTRMTKAKVYVINKYLDTKHDGKYNILFHSSLECCGARLKMNNQGVIVYDMSKMKRGNNECVSDREKPNGQVERTTCASFNRVNDGDPVTDIDTVWQRLKDFPGGFGDKKYMVEALASEGWLDAVRDKQIYDKDSYMARIKDWCDKEPTAQCAAKPQKPFTPEQRIANCVNDGIFPKYDEHTFLVAWSDLWKLKDRMKWDSTTHYTIGSLASYNDNEWVAVSPITGQAPSTETGWVLRPASFVNIGNDNVPTIDPQWKQASNMVLISTDVSKPRDPIKSKEFIDTFGKNFVEFNNKRDTECQKTKDDVPIDNFADWMAQIGDKYNSPCPNVKDQASDPLFYTTGLAVDRPICRQWRSDGTNLSKDPALNGNLLSFENRIRETGWTRDEKGNPIDDEKKWVWQHDTTVPREILGLNEYQPGGCDFPPKTEDGKIFQASPEECLEKQIQWKAMAEAEIEASKCTGGEMACVDWGKIAMQLAEFGVEQLGNFMSAGVGGKWLAGTLSDLLVPGCLPRSNPNWRKVKCDLKSLDENIKSATETAVKEIFKQLKGNVNQQATNPSKAQAYLDRFGEDKKYPSFTDPVLIDSNGQYKVYPDETPANRRISLLQRRLDLSEQVTKINGKLPPRAVDMLGYDPDFRNQVDKDPNASWRVRGGKKTTMTRERADAIGKQVADFITRLAEDFYSMRTRGIRGGAQPHSKFESLLKKINISPQAYLAEARSKAKKAGLHWQLLGFSDDEKHKLQIPNMEGKLIHFGASGMGDHILYTMARDPTADKHRKNYRARASKIRGNWHNEYSPNSLALAILW